MHKSMTKQQRKDPTPEQQQPYDNLLKSLFEGQEQEVFNYFLEGANARLLYQAIDHMVEYCQNDAEKLARELRWMGILLRRADIVPLEDKRQIEERLYMFDDLMARDP